MLSKKVNKSGGVTIPQQLRHEFGIGAGTALDIISKDGGLFITKHAPTCRFCGSQDNVIEVNQIEVCNNCADDIVRRFRADDSNSNNN